LIGINCLPFGHDLPMFWLPKYSLSVFVLSAGALLLIREAKAQSAKIPTVLSACAPCHGLDGVGHDVEIPNIAGQHSIYLRSQLLAFKKGTRKHPEMQYLGRKMTERELNEAVVYYSTLLSR
jgi:cytochrome c553